MTPVRLEPAAASRSQVKQSTTEPLRSLSFSLNFECFTHKLNYMLCTLSMCIMLTIFDASIENQNVLPRMAVDSMGRCTPVYMPCSCIWQKCQAALNAPIFSPCLQEICKTLICYHTILRKTIEGYLDSVPSLTFNTIKTLLTMHAFHISRHLHQNGCFILVTLQWFKYSANPNGSTLYTEKSQTFKNDWNPFLSFVFHIDWLQNHRWFSL